MFGKARNRKKQSRRFPHISEEEQKAQPKREMKLGFGQIFVGTSFIGGMLILVFVFGFHAGREQGVHTALASQDDHMVRMPLVPPPDLGQGSVGLVGENLPPDAFLPVDSGARARLDDPKNTPRDDREFDFSPTTKSAAPKKIVQTDIPGIAAKSSLSAMDSAKPKAQAKRVIANASVKKKLADAEMSAPTPRKVRTPAPKQLVKKPKKVAKVTPPPARRKSASSGLGAGWYVQVIAANSKKEADRIISRLGRSGISGDIQTARVKNATYYRVLVGPYRNKTQAQQKQRDIRGLGITNGSPFLKRVS